MYDTHTETYYIHELLKNKINLFIYYYFFKKIKIVRFQNYKLNRLYYISLKQLINF